jgi:hypothetical protein
MLDTLIWWKRLLLGKLRDFGIYVDASTSWGVGIVISERWYAIQLRKNGNTRVSTSAGSRLLPSSYVFSSSNSSLSRTFTSSFDQTTRA